MKVTVQFDVPEDRPKFASAAIEPKIVIDLEAETVSGFLARCDADGNPLKSDAFAYPISPAALQIITDVIVASARGRAELPSGELRAIAAAGNE